MTDRSSSTPTPDGAAGSEGISPEFRARIVEQYGPYVRAIAKKVKESAGAKWTLEQLVDFGAVGLVEAAANHDPQGGANFMTQAYYAIRGAIYEGIRRSGGRLSGDDAKALFETRANDLLATVSSHDGTGAMQSLAASVQSLAVAYIASTDAVGIGGLDQARSLLRVALAELHDHERKLFKLLYYRGLNLTQAAERLGLSKARAQRLHQRVLQKTHEVLESKVPG